MLERFILRNDKKVLPKSRGARRSRTRGLHVLRGDLKRGFAS